MFRKGEKTLFKYKRLIAVFAALVLSVVFFTGCTDTVGETGKEEAGINDTGASSGSEQASGDSRQTDDYQEKQATANAEGTIKSFDADTGTITIVTDDDDQLVLTISGESKIFVGTSPEEPYKLSDAIGSKVTAEYLTETKIVTAISIKS